jgi:hypothetical protein
MAVVNLAGKQKFAGSKFEQAQAGANSPGLGRFE